MRALTDATNPDLTRFLKQRKGKLLLYHGWADATAHPEPTLDYYNAVVKTTYGGDIAAARNDVRLFMAPGMGHCDGGPGPDTRVYIVATSLGPLPRPTIWRRPETREWRPWASIRRWTTSPSFIASTSWVRRRTTSGFRRPARWWPRGKARPCSSCRRVGAASRRQLGADARELARQRLWRRGRAVPAQGEGADPDRLRRDDWMVTIGGRRHYKEHAQAVYAAATASPLRTVFEAGGDHFCTGHQPEVAQKTIAWLTEAGLGAKGPSARPAARSFSVELVTVNPTERTRMAGALHTPTGAAKPDAVILQHGAKGNFYSGVAGDLAPALAERGYLTLTINRRDHDGGLRPRTSRAASKTWGPRSSFWHRAAPHA